MRMLSAIFGLFLAIGGAAIAGENLSPEALLPGHEATDAHAPAMAFGKDVFLLVWEAGRGEKADVVGLRLDKTGKPLDAKPFVISGAKDCQERPRAAFGGGVFLVVWHDLRGGKDWDVYAARVTPEGKVLDAEGIAVSTEKHNQVSPELCFNGTNFQLLWRDMRGAVDYEIYGGRVSPEGRPLDGSGVLVQKSMGNAFTTMTGLPGVGSNGAGAMIGAVKGGQGMQLWTMREGSPVGKPQGVFKADRSGNCWDPVFASDGQKILMVFTTFRQISRGGSWGSSGALLLDPDPKGLPATPIAVSSLPPVDSDGKIGLIRNPAPAWDGSGYVIAWDMELTDMSKEGRASHPYDVGFLRRISREGATQGDTVRMGGELDSPVLHPAAASDGAGTTIVAYERHPKTPETPIKIGVRVLTNK